MKKGLFQPPHQEFLPGHMHIINPLLDPDADEKLVKSSIIWTLKFQHPKYCNFLKPVSDCEQVYEVGFRVC